MKKSIIIIALLFAHFSFGQVAVKKSVIDSGGGSTTVGNITVISSLGELAVQENTQGTVHISEGFIGPDILGILGIQDYSELQNINIFPNPVTDNFQVTLPRNKTYEFALYDLNGKQVFYQTATGKHQQFNIEHLQSAVYLLIIIDRETHKKKIMKLQKT